MTAGDHSESRKARVGGDAFERGRERDRRICELLESVGLIAVALDLEGRVTYCNDYLLDRLGRSREEVEGRSWFDLAIPEEDRERIGGVFRGVLDEHPSSRCYVNEILSATGERMTIEWNNTVLRDGDGRRDGVASIGRDVTDERRLVAEMRLASHAIDAAISGVAIAGTDGVLTRVNAAFAQLWGLDGPEDAVGRHATEFWEQPEAASEVIRRMFEVGVVDTEMVAATARGPRTMRVRGSLIRGPEGEVTAIMGTFHDVTEQRRLEARLTQAQRIAGLGNWEWNRERDTLWWSDEVYRIFGVSPGSFEVSLDGFMARVHPDDRHLVEEAISEAFERDERYSVEHRLLRPDGSVRWVAETAQLWRDGGGQAIGMLGTVQDITDRHLAEDELRRANELLATVVANAPVVIFALDREGVFTLSEGKTLSRIGLAPGQVVGRPALELFGDVEGFEDAFARACAGETVPLSSHAGEVEFDAVYAPMIGRTGEVEGVIGVGLDVTEQRRLEAELAASQRIEAVGMLAGGVAHDFNNMLAVILSGTYLLERTGALDGQAADDLRQIRDAATRAANLTQQLLAIGRRQAMQPRELDLNEIARSLKQILRRLVGAAIEVRFRLEEDLPVVTADRTQIDQVLMNLVVNARDAMPEGGMITIATERREIGSEPHPTLGAGSYVCLVVEDTGVGMAPAVRERVFEPFFSTKPAGKGTGLGLASTHGIVRQTGGDIELDSAPGEGACFRVLLPAGEPSAEPADGEGEEKTPAFRGTGLLILLVDDDPQIRYVATRALEDEGFRVITATDGADALDRLAQLADEVSLVLSDVVMPQMSGVQFAGRARAVAGPDLPFLFMTGYSEATTYRYGMERGLDTLVQKPFTPDQLLTKVREALAGAG